MIEHRKQDHAAYWGQPNDVWTHDDDTRCSHCEIERLRALANDVIVADDAVQAESGRLYIEAKMQKVEAIERLRAALAGAEGRSRDEGVSEEADRG